MHDCIPTDAHAARRRATDQIFASVTRYPHSWAGDVWKIGAILQDYRPDIRLYFFNSPPTGLLAATNLDPHSEVLHNSYFDIVDKFSQATEPRHTFGTLICTPQMTCETFTGWPTSSGCGKINVQIALRCTGVVIYGETELVAYHYHVAALKRG